MTPMIRRLLVGVVLGLAVFIAMGVYADATLLLHSLAHFTWWLLLPAIGLSGLNWLLRFIKWQLYLRWIGARVPVRDSAIVFLSGFSMAVTPGKFGELLKAVLLQRRNGVPLTATASVVIAERLTDFIALVVLCAGGVASTRYGVKVFLVAVVGSLAVVGVVASERLSLWAIALFGRLPRVGGFAPKLEEMYRAMAVLLRPGPLLLTTAISVVAWSCEALGFHLLLGGVSDATSSLGTAVFIYAFATIFGAVTLLPGGLGATEGSFIGLTYTVFGLARTREAATSATLLIRFCTLWLAVIVGLGVLAATGGLPASVDTAATPGGESADGS